MTGYAFRIINDFIEFAWLHHIPWFILFFGILSGVTGLLIERKNKTASANGEME